MISIGNAKPSLHFQKVAMENMAVFAEGNTRDE